MNEYLAIIQTAAVLIAAGGVLVALRIARDDRRAARHIAERDRAIARWEQERRYRLELLARLSENYERGGSTDPSESRRLGAEASALITALGPDVVPELFILRGSIDQARSELKLVQPDDWAWHHKADAVAVALHEVAMSEPPGDTHRLAL